MDTIENRILRTTKTIKYLFYLTFDFFNLHLHQNKNLTTRKNENIMLALNQHTSFKPEIADIIILSPVYTGLFYLFFFVITKKIKQNSGRQKNPEPTNYLLKKS